MPLRNKYTIFISLSICLLITSCVKPNLGTRFKQIESWQTKYHQHKKWHICRDWSLADKTPMKYKLDGTFVAAINANTNVFKSRHAIV